MKTKCTH